MSPPMPSGIIAPPLLEPKTPNPIASTISANGDIIINSYDPTVDNELIVPPGFGADFLGAGIAGSNNPAQDALAPGATSPGDRLIAMTNTTSVASGWFLSYGPSLSTGKVWERTADGSSLDNIPAASCGVVSQIFGFRNPGTNYEMTPFFLNGEYTIPATDTNLTVPANPLLQLEIDNPGLYARFMLYKGQCSSLLNPVSIDPDFTKTAEVIGGVGGQALVVIGIRQLVQSVAEAQFNIPYQTFASSTKAATSLARIIEIL